MGHQTVLVYQMGKVASLSIYNSLKAEGIHVLHTHQTNPDRIREMKQSYPADSYPASFDKGLSIFEKFIKPRRPLKIITLIREPIGRNLSAYFHNMRHIEAHASAHQQYSTQELINNFFSHYHHQTCLCWFDLEMKATLGIDVYHYRFPQHLGFQKITKPPYDLLIMRHDLDDAKKAAIVSAFLDIEPFKIARANESANKEYAGQYSSVLDTIQIPDEYAQIMLSSKYARHFFSGDELGAIRSQWTRPRTLSSVA